METVHDSFHSSFLQYGIISSFATALFTGCLTWSLKSMIIVYFSAVCFLMFYLIPDWDFFFKRSISEWIVPMASDEESRNLQKERFPVLKKSSKYARREDVHPFGILLFVGCLSCSVYFAWKFAVS